MKKKRVFCFLVVLLVFGFMGRAEPLEVPNYSFEYDEYGVQVPGWSNGLEGTPQYWTYVSGCDDDTWEDASTDGIVSAAIGGTDTLYQLLDHKVYPGDEYLLRFDAYYAWAEGGIYDGTYQGILYYDDNGSRVPIAVSNGAGIKYTWVLNNDLKITVPDGSPSMGRRLGIALATNQGNGNWMAMDNVRLEMLTSPGRAHEPDPANGELMVLLDKVLSWHTGVDPNDVSQVNPNIFNHFVYMSNGEADDPNLILVATIPAGNPPAATAQYTPPTELERDGVYYWRVDEGSGSMGPDDPNIIKGRLWSFSTVESVPMFVPGYPLDAAVWPGDNVVFTVQAVNPYSLDTTDLLYAWYKEGSSTVLSTTDSLEITDAQAEDDEGEYYCRVTLDSTALSADSVSAQLIIKRTIGHWPFDGNMNDIVAGNSGTMIGGGASYEDGIIDSGEAIEFTGNAKEAAKIPTDAHINLAWTIGWWEKSDDTKTGGTWETMVACGAGTGWEIFDFTRYMAVRYAFGFETDGQQRVISGDYIFTPYDIELYPRGEWHYHVVSNDPSTKIALWYIDGKKYGEFHGYDFESFDEVLYLGNMRDMSQAYAGLIDDLKLYNYVLDAMTIALEYSNTTGEEICVELPEGDFNGDCYVGIEDLLEIVDSWLLCNLRPAEMCP